MKKCLLFAIVLLVSLGQLFAAPVDVNTAQTLGEKFVKANMKTLRDFQKTEHVYTLSDGQGNACLYIFNIDDRGYVIVSADDRAKPILAYSEEGAIDVNNIPSSMSYYLEHYMNSISFVIENNIEATEDIINEWNLVRAKGVVMEKGLGRSVEPLVNLLWNQDYPYNYYCPTAPGGPGGRAYVGCAADAMAMLMKYWNYPDAGVGEHSYIPPGFPEQSITLGEEYDWDNMPIQISSSSPQNQIHAIAILMYHCGVTINMGYAADGSGAYSEDVPEAMSSHFKYTEEMRHEYRDTYTKTEWEDMLISNFDQGFPVYYAGQSNSSGGHAFICDGYNENRYIHFNWGWSGWANGYFAIDAVNPPGYNFSSSQRAIIDFLPDYVYNNMVSEAEIEAETDNAYSHKGIIKVVVPTESITGEPLEKVDEMVLMRNNTIIQTIENPTPGEVVYFEDEVPDYDCYDYVVYGVTDGVKGRFSNIKLQYGPKCSWKLICTTTNFQGWNGGKVQILNSFGTVIDEVTMTSSTPTSEVIAMPEGEISLKWVAPTATVSSLSIRLKDSSNEEVYEYSGASSGLTAGVIFSTENTCEGCDSPDNIQGEYAMQDGNFGALISWENGGEPQSFKIYRSEDGIEYEEVGSVDPSQHQYFDIVAAGSYYYQVTAYNSHCESQPAMNGDVDYVIVDVTSVEENMSAMIYPNPTSDVLNIKMDEILTISVYNTVGQLIMYQEVDADECVLNMNNLNSGVYMVKIVSRNHEMIKQIAVID